MPTKFQLITELYDQTVQSVTGSYQSWTGFLRAACYNYKCPFDDQILIYAQRPDATAVLEMERWNKRFGRWVNRGAKSIAVFGDDGQNCLKLYFDVSDTHASRFARPLPIWTMHPAFEPEVIETLEATFGNLAEKENLADAVRSACHNAVADNFTDYLQDLRECREDSLLEELDDLNLEVFYRDALEVSVAYMLMTRLGLRADEYFSPDEFAHVYEFNTPTTINALAVVGRAILQESSLAFLGLSDPLARSWGMMIARAVDFPGLYRTDFWTWWLLPPVGALVLSTLLLRLLVGGLEEQQRRDKPCCWK